MKLNRHSYKKMNTARQKWIQMHGLSIAIFVVCVISLAIVGGTADKSSTSFDEKMGFTGKYNFLATKIIDIKTIIYFEFDVSNSVKLFLSIS